MLRYQTCFLTQVLQKSKPLFSTAINPEKNAPQSLIQTFPQKFTDIPHVKNTMKKGDVKNIHFDEWKARINVMKKYDFTDKECFEMIHKYPTILKIPTDNFQFTIEEWFSAALGFSNFQLLLRKHPELLSVNAADIKKRLANLNYFFGSSKTVKLLLNSPSVMFDNWPSVESKLDYLLKKRRFSRHEIIEACALSIPMDQIKLRLDILEKCGIFKQETRPIHKINKYEKTGHKNPQLKAILLFTDTHFANIAKITVEEYAACRDLFMSNIYDEDDEEPNTYKNHCKNSKYKNC